MTKEKYSKLPNSVSMHLKIVFDFETEDILLGGTELQILEPNKLEETEL